MSKRVEKQTEEGALLPRLTLILAKIAEVMHWGFAIVMLIIAVMAIIQPTGVGEWI